MAAIPKPSYKRRAPKRGERGKFNKKTRDLVYERDNGICQQCGQAGTEIHHVKYKSQLGRGVFTNALTLCQPCHRKVHMEAELSDYWINVYVDRYGTDFYKDEWDR